MSGLAALLAGRREPGVYRWWPADGVDGDDVRTVVAASRWSLAHLEVGSAGTRAETLAGLVRALGLPDGAGANLDALWDGLRELAGPTVLLWPGWSVLARVDPAGLDGVLLVLGERAAEERDLSVLLTGAGPDLDPPLPLLA